MDTTNRKLAAAAREGPHQYYAAVLESTKIIHARLTATDTLNALVIGSDVARLKDLLITSLVLNDCTSVVFNHKGALKVSIPEPQQYAEMFGCETVRFNVTEEQIREHGIDPKTPFLRPCFIYSDNSAQRPLLNALAPFIEDGNVVFQPSRGILSKKEGPNAWHVLGVESKLPLDLWEPNSEGIACRPTPMEIQGVGSSTPALFEVTLPFLRGVPLRDIHRMLNDEKDLVLAFRSAIRSAVREATKSTLTVPEIISDVVQPKVIALDRKLRSLQRIHRLKIGGAAMSSVALAFTATASAGSIGTGLLAIASAGGFSFVANQYSDYLAKRDELHQDPYYFLWKARRAGSTGASQETPSK
jgi:hypothetical protein